jgi:hypothetical protein
METHTSLIAALATIEHKLATRVQVWRVVINASGRIVKRIYRGSFTAPPGSHIGEPKQKENT